MLPGRHKPVLALTSRRAGFYIGVVNRRNQLLALFCLLVFFAFGVFYFRYWVVQKPFGIILFIGEGLDARRLAQARLLGDGADEALAIDGLPYVALLKNASRDSAAPDSAAAATALATGVRVNNGQIGLDAEGDHLPNLLELARASGRMTGLVTNGQLTNPVAASFYAHTSAQDNRPEIARQLAQKAQIDLVLGGGSAEFLPEAKGGRRQDGRDLLGDFREAEYDVVRTLEELEEIPRWRRVKLVGLFGADELSSGEKSDISDDRPTLADMVRRGIELLQFNRSGYLLVVDAHSMRESAQESDAGRAALETRELDRAVAVALEYAGTKAMILVCGDVTLADSIPTLSPTPAEPPVKRPEDVVAFGSGLGADALQGGIHQSTVIFEIVRDNL